MRLGRDRLAARMPPAPSCCAACGGGGDDADSADEHRRRRRRRTFAAGTHDGQARRGRATITVGTKFDQPGFGLKNLDGKPEGFDVEIAKIIAGELGIEPEDIEWVETPSAIREEVHRERQGRHVVATYTINDKRKERIAFAGPYYVAGQQHHGRKADNDTITGPDSLKDNPDEGLLGHRLDARRRRSRSTWPAPTSWCCSTTTASAPTRCATARSTR